MCYEQLVIVTIVYHVCFVFFTGFDFDSVVQILTFTSDVNELSVSVPINNDFIAEGLEQFSAILSGEPEPAARIVQNTSTVFIADDDGRLLLY